MREKVLMSIAFIIVTIFLCQQVGWAEYNFLRPLASKESDRSAKSPESYSERKRILDAIRTDPHLKGLLENPPAFDPMTANDATETLGSGGQAIIFIDPTNPRNFYKVSLGTKSYNDVNLKEFHVSAQMRDTNLLGEIPQLISVSVNSEGLIQARFAGVSDNSNAASLGGLLTQGLFTSRLQRITILIKTARILKKLHGKGWVHDDIKPGNIIFSPAGEELAAATDFEVMIVDLATAHRENKPGLDKGGTHKYMSPERIATHRTDHQSDIYSFGVTVRGMLRASSFGDIFPVASRADLESFLKSVREFTNRMLSKNPEERPHIDEVISELEKLKLFLMQAIARYKGPNPAAVDVIRKEVAENDV